MNRIDRFFRPAAGVAALLVGIFLILGGQGHLAAMLEVVRESRQPLGFEHLSILATGGILLVPGMLNLGLAWWILRGRRAAVLTALLATLAAFVYLVYLLIIGVPDHPIATFVIVLGVHLFMLAATLKGLAVPDTPLTAD